MEKWSKYQDLRFPWKCQIDTSLHRWKVKEEKKNRKKNPLATKKIIIRKLLTYGKSIWNIDMFLIVHINLQSLWSQPTFFSQEADMGNKHAILQFSQTIKKKWKNNKIKGSDSWNIFALHPTFSSSTRLYFVSV